MKYVLGLLCSLATLPGQAADFRFLDFGDHCQDIVMQERGMGATLESSGHGRYTFRGTHLQHPVTIAYECRNERFSRGIFVFEFHDFDAAKRFFNRQKGEFIAFYGVPDLDQGAAGYADYMASIGFEIEDAHQYMLGWELPDKNVLFGASPAAGEAGRALVTVDIAPSQK
ncbi:hypothetical protein Tel_08955 [Candidatus Tenderia electrophaga]|jgi:hypothetical protein|uniref:Uncharacterized protein n=1 Tax=Candidatus Tenderia electrophaga TaxID=1748243 RepID=A0A0S2TDP8_9GAMM|nr:hypothetical protein Tel_08955 [Candidatus Tenderia electrophaga]